MVMSAVIIIIYYDQTSGGGEVQLNCRVGQATTFFQPPPSRIDILYEVTQARSNDLHGCQRLDPPPREAGVHCRCSVPSVCVSSHHHVDVDAPLRRLW